MRTNRTLNSGSYDSLCPLCGCEASDLGITEDNVRFLQQRSNDGTLDPAITLSRIAWENFPGLKLNADSKAIVSSLLKGVQDEVASTLKPLEIFTKMVSSLSDKLEELIETLPEGVKKEFCEINLQLTGELKTIREATAEATEPVQRDLKELSDTISQLINKPISKGLINEETFKLSWQEVFVKDKTIKKGGAGRADIIIIPYLELDRPRFGQKIIVERKAGKQKYCANHLQEVIEHARAEGSTYGLLIYDNYSNLLEMQKPLYLTMSDGMTIAVADAESGGWKTARQIFEVLQSVLSNDTTQVAEKIDIAKLMRTIEEMQTINNQIELLRKSNNSALASCEKIRTTINGLEESVANYKQKLREILMLKTHLRHPIQKNSYNSRARTNEARTQ